MANKLLVIHGYSDGSTSFTALGEFLIGQQIYAPENVFYLDYSSMDDDATFHDFADKLDADHRTRLASERIDVVCHSTGSLVVRAWLALHADRTLRRGGNAPCPVDRLICFAPANFGSDLAALGQSFLGKFRTTFFNSHAHREDFMESGKLVLQGLEPASPFQWDLSVDHDLHSERSYFRSTNGVRGCCYVFVLAASQGYDGLQAKLVPKRAMPGTDGTVRIAGTSLNTRGCSVDFRTDGAEVLWWPETKFKRVPFAVFDGFNHGSIIDPTHEKFSAAEGPGTLAVEALRKVRNDETYDAMAKRFDEASARNYSAMPKERQVCYQQFFFRVRDDVNQLVDDFYIDFHVVNADGTPNEDLTVEFDEYFKTSAYRHSASAAHRVMMLNCSHVEEFGDDLTRENARLMIEITGVCSLPDVSYHTSTFVAYDPTVPPNPGEPTLLFPNTTTFIDVILDRCQGDKLLEVKDGRLLAIRPVEGTGAPLTGRAALVRNEQAESVVQRSR